MILRDKVVLITGGTGSFGQGFVKKLLQTDVQVIRIFSRDEHKQKDMEEKFPDSRLRFFLGDIRDKDRIRLAMRDVDYVIHAAAYKQVQKAEYNPGEAIKTNIYGTENVVAAALENNVETMLLVSTDKAVQPINLYGATKMCAERYVIAANSYRGKGRTKFCVTRYGNVAGTRSTVVPLFFELKLSGKHIPISDKESTRFWLTLEEANEFVLNCLDLERQLHGGEIFIPLLASIKIIDLKEVIAPELPVIFTGLRPGDKLHETLVSATEMKRTLRLDWCSIPMFIICPENPSWFTDYHSISAKCALGDHKLLPGYNSENNSNFLPVSKIRESVKEWFVNGWHKTNDRTRKNALDTAKKVYS